MNIVTQLIGFVMLALLLNHLSLSYLFALLVLAVVSLGLTQQHGFLRLIKRLKWFFVVTFLVFTFNTPGEHIPQWPFAMSPSYEGLNAAGLQVMRLMLMLAVVSLILALNTRQQLISGLYYLLQPLKYIKLDARRFAARLWLTLHYVELQQTAAKPAHDLPLSEHLKQMLQLNVEPADAEIQVIHLEIPNFSYLDYVCISIFCVLGFALFWKAWM